ncbi:NAD(P)/FAD-dependent oxidoreductase [Capillimicrobium parvum]|uniref:Gamma-glutamylputrescine oxidoreductase n=1 Tax=Capillimicrobium parvum TaxID=2884022 RepID=A0A9E6XZD4_9ACTN|nr:FAD-dependent oxidoreductase [Capillimicrobium parvum]UGS37269.1 Gamma-glutamylputrescine oxidoreductase [Capillimicrobium parvum]
MNPNSAVLADPGRISHWFKQLYPPERALVPRPALTESRAADVCIVGAGYTGLWTAYALRRADPSLDVVLLDAEIAGYGASGRNGGAVIAQFNGSREYWTKRGGRAGTQAMERAVRESVVEVGAAVEREGIDCSYARNGVVMVARTPLETERFRASIDEDREWGWTEEDSRLLTAAEVQERIKVDGALGARYNAHCASIHPGALVRGLADTVERLGATIYEGTRVTAIEPGLARTAAGHTVRARTVVRATEAYTESLETHRRIMVPVHTSMLVTEVLPDHIWAQIGWAGREALLAEHPFLHLQHTADHRITIGGDDNRVPYRYASAPNADEGAPPRVLSMYRRELVRLFPALRDVRIDHSWQGVFAAPRNWAPGVGYDAGTGLAWAGGYVGEGVATSNLAGRALADLILGRDTELTRLPFVGPPARRWEPEPLRAIGSGAIAVMRQIGDRAELRTGKPSKVVELGNRVAGYTGHVG